jgi:hypothetical protein
MSTSNFIIFGDEIRLKIVDEEESFRFGFNNRNRKAAAAGASDDDDDEMGGHRDAEELPQVAAIVDKGQKTSGGPVAGAVSTREVEADGELRCGGGV